MAAMQNKKRLVFTCDACGHKLTKRTSYRMHSHLRHDVWRCDNDACGACYVGNSELVSIATRSGDPSAPAPELPPTKVYERRLVKLTQFNAVTQQQLDFVDVQERQAELERAAQEMRDDGFGEDQIRTVLANVQDATIHDDEEESMQERQAELERALQEIRDYGFCEEVVRTVLAKIMAVTLGNNEGAAACKP